MILAAIFLLLGLLIGIHLVTAALAALRYVRPEPAEPGDLPFLSLIRPVCGIDRFDEETLRSSFEQDYPEYEILFCVQSPDDPVVDLVERLIAEHPGAKAELLIGDSRLSGNPKLNNVAKGVALAGSNLLAMTDANLLLPRDYLRRLMATWRDDTGLVSAPAIGTRPGNLWGAVECAFLNTSQARWQLAADALGLGFAQGKTLFWRRDVLEAGGGLAALGRNLAEDVASTRLVRDQGLKVRIVQRLFAQPVGPRDRSAVWSRQLRWSQIRREGFPAIFALEILQGPFVPLVLALAVSGHAPWALLPGLVVLWYGTEWALARIAGWPAGARDLLAMILRDILLPALWIATFCAKGFTWRGNRMGADTKAAPSE